MLSINRNTFGRMLQSVCTGNISNHQYATVNSPATALHRPGAIVMGSEPKTDGEKVLEEPLTRLHVVSAPAVQLCTWSILKIWWFLGGIVPQLIQFMNRLQ